MAKRTRQQIMDDAMQRWGNELVHRPIPVWRIMALAEMAENGISPNAKFGDDECCVFEAFERMYSIGYIDGRMVD